MPYNAYTFAGADAIRKQGSSKTSGKGKEGATNSSNKSGKCAVTGMSRSLSQ